MKPLLVALDGSSHAEASLPVAVGLARHLRAPLHLVSVLERDPWRYATGGAPFADRQLERELASDWRAALHRHLDDRRARIEGLPEAPTVRTRVLDGPVADTLLAEVAAVDAAMLVVTTHGRGGLSRSWIGSVTDALVRTEYERDLAEQRSLVIGYLRGVESRLPQEGLRVSHCAHEEFDPPRAVCECADTLDADLIAVATRARGPLPRALVGSVADKILRTTNRPVLLYCVSDAPST